MDKRIIEKVNKEIEQFIDNKRMVTNKEVATYLLNALDKDALRNLDDSEMSTMIRFKLSSLTKDGRLERISNGIYKNISSFKNDALNSKYFINDFEYEIKSELYDLLESQYKGKWSFSGQSLKRRIGISEQKSKWTTINISSRWTSKLEKLIIEAREMNVRITTHNLFEANNINMFSIAEIMSNDYLNIEQANVIKRHIEHVGDDPYDLIFHIGINFIEDKDAWKKAKIDWALRNRFKDNFKKLISGGKYE